jgi:hypothetical protein
LANSAILGRSGAPAAVPSSTTPSVGGSSSRNTVAKPKSADRHHYEIGDERQHNDVRITQRLNNLRDSETQTHCQIVLKMTKLSSAVVTTLFNRPLNVTVSGFGMSGACRCLMCDGDAA